MNIDQKKIKAAIHDTVLVIKRCKEARRLPPGGWPTGEEYVARDRATWLCTIQAHRRGKMHIQGRFTDLEAQKEWIGDTWMDFKKEELEPAA